VDYRRQLAAWELLGYGADVICLQEVSRDVYDSYLLPLLTASGYDGVYANKVTKHTPIGCATFYLKDCFEPVAAPEILDLTQGWRAHEDMAAIASSRSPAALQLVKALEVLALAVLWHLLLASRRLRRARPFAPLPCPWFESYLRSRYSRGMSASSP
jgi:mRNA deadenylase 3'-5' endonuclease subunit Ccr4